MSEAEQHNLDDLNRHAPSKWSVTSVNNDDWRTVLLCRYCIRHNGELVMFAASAAEVWDVWNVIKTDRGTVSGEGA